MLALPPRITVEEMLSATAGCFRGDPGVDSFRWIERNSRNVHPGDLFLAVTGERFDGHDFVADAFRNGAAAALVRNDQLGQFADDYPLFIVDDPVLALQQIATQRLKRGGQRVVGITGSLGKTSTKEVVAAVLSQRYPTYRSPGNMNSEIGLPLSLLEVPESAAVVVLEMGGAYALGELTLLAKIASPGIGIVTNVHPIHLERMGTIEAIAATKAELPAAIPENGVVILNGDDHRVRSMRTITAAKVITVGRQPGNDLQASAIKSMALGGARFDLNYQGQTHHFSTRLLGDHAVELALCGIAAGLAMDMSFEEIAAGLNAPEIQVRLVVKGGPNGAQIIDDTYNAAAPSVLSALSLLEQIETDRRIAVLGDMRELGELSEQHHRAVGQRVAGVVDLLVTFGDLARTIAEEALDQARIDDRHIDVTSFGLAQRDELTAFLLTELRSGDTVLLKGSRGLEMETIVDMLTGQFETPVTPS